MGVARVEEREIEDESEQEDAGRTKECGDSDQRAGCRCTCP